MIHTNKVFLAGIFGKDADIRTVGERSVARLSLATTKKFKNKTGEMVEETTWHNVEYWLRFANEAEYLKKGQSAYIEGEYVSEKYVDKTGTERVIYKVKAYQVIPVISGPAVATQPRVTPSAPPQYQMASTAATITDSLNPEEHKDDLPF